MKEFNITKSLILIGGGKHGNVLISYLKEQNQKIIGYTDNINNGLIQDVPYLGTDDVIFKYDPNDVILVNGLGSIGDNTIRKNIFCKFKNKGYFFKTIIHKKAILSKPYEIKEGVQILAGAIIQPNAKIEENSIINSGVIVEHDCIIGQHVHISPGSVLSGGVTVGNETHIGTNSTIIQEIKIGEKSLIGAGSTVIRNIGNNVACWGTPAKERRKNE